MEELFGAERFIHDYFRSLEYSAYESVFGLSDQAIMTSRTLQELPIVMQTPTKKRKSASELDSDLSSEDGDFSYDSIGSPSEDSSDLVEEPVTILDFKEKNEIPLVSSSPPMVVESIDIENSRLKIKRPMNSFMLFSNELRPVLQSIHPDHTNNDISKLLGNIWKSMSEEQKNPYVQRAAKIKAEFAVQHPDFTYSKNQRKKQKKRKHDTPGQEFRTIPEIENLEDQKNKLNFLGNLYRRNSYTKLLVE